MKTTTRIASLAAGLALAAAPAFANGTPPSNSGTAHKPSTATTAPATAPAPQSDQGASRKPSTPGPGAGLPAKAKAYGKYCQGQSKKRSDAAPGTKGTPFSQCVTAMAKAAHTAAPTTTTIEQEAVARSACKGMSRKHVSGQKGTAYGKCVAGAAKLLKTLKSHS